MSELVVNERDGMVRFAVRVVTRASRTRVEGIHDGALKVRLLAPPVDGTANAALIKLVAERLAIPASRVRILRGMTSRTKILAIEHVDEAAVRRLVPQAAR